MIYELAKPEDIQAVYNVVQHTIKTIYPKYYPMEVVDFFSEHHSEDAIEKDIKNGYVSVLKIDGTIVATGCFVDDHITRAYVLPEHQKKGYGTFIRLFRGNGGLKTATTPVFIHAKRHSVFDLEVECVYQSIQGTPYRAYFVCF